jgi:hypothetical protein
MSNWLDKWAGKVKIEDDCVRFVDDVGFCTIDPAESAPDFPCQADAMGLTGALGETWFWKDDLHVQKRLYYTRLFFNKPGYISMEYLPAFIATNGQVADELIIMGRMPVTQQAILQVIEADGPIPTRDLKKKLTTDAARQSSSALISLERLFITTKVDITGRTRQSYGYVWDLAERWVPWAFEEADRLGSVKAKAKIMDKLAANGIEAEAAGKAFGW